jgi:hypothetical protein
MRQPVGPTPICSAHAPRSPWLTASSGLECASLRRPGVRIQPCQDVSYAGCG